MLRRLFGGSKKGSSPPPSSPGANEWSGTTRDEWTMPGVYFRPAGWRLSEGTSTRMAWVGKYGGTMTLTCETAPEWTAADLDLDAVRARERARASARQGGLVSAEFVEMANGALALEVVSKYGRGGYTFEGRLLIDESPQAYSIVVTVAERDTGMRESLVNALRMQCGELTIAALMSGPADPVTGGRAIPGMQLDPYDPAFDAEATYSASDDPRLDEVMQTHPLAVTRSTLRWAQATWECDARARSTEQGVRTTHPPLPPSSGPRLVLTDAFFKQLSEMVKDRPKADA